MAIAIVMPEMRNSLKYAPKTRTFQIQTTEPLHFSHSNHLVSSFYYFLYSVSRKS